MATGNLQSAIKNHYKSQFGPDFDTSNSIFTILGFSRFHTYPFTPYIRYVCLNVCQIVTVIVVLTNSFSPIHSNQYVTYIFSS